MITPSKNPLAIAELDDADRASMLNFIDAFVTKNRIKAVFSPDTA